MTLAEPPLGQSNGENMHSQRLRHACFGIDSAMHVRVRLLT